MVRSTRTLLLVMLTILSLTAGWFFISQSSQTFAREYVDEVKITNRLGKVLVLSEPEAREVVNALGEALNGEPVDRIKTLFPNEVTFYQSGNRTLTVYAANIEMFNKGKRQVIRPGVSRDQAYLVQDHFYEVLQQITDKNRFSLVTD